jgi:hypothetical protein
MQRDSLGSRPVPGDALPEFELREDLDDLAIALQHAQRAVLAHPAAAKALMAALAAEGRRFGATPAGTRWRVTLERSRLAHELSAAFDLATLSVTDDEPDAMLPGNLIDVLFTIAERGLTDEIVNRLYEWEEGDHD